MRISFENLKLIVENLKSFLVKKRIIDIVLVNSRLFLFKLKNTSTKFLVDLDNTNPHVGLLNYDYDELTLPSEFIAKAMLRGSPLIDNVELINNDKVIRLTTSSTDAYYHRHHYYLYIELINAHANMILCDEKNKIIVAFYETNLMSPRLIVKNYQYQLPNKKNEDYHNDKFNLNDYQKDIELMFQNSIQKRKKELYGVYIKHYEKLIKSLNKKIIKIKESLDNANNADKYREMGNILLMNQNEIHHGDVIYQNIKLDPSKNAIDNANVYFNKYKKAKRTVILSKTILEKTNQELNDAIYNLDALNYANENEIKLLVKDNQSKKPSIRAYLPYFVTYQGTNYYFGHNALENDYLTFKMFKKSSEVIWLHLKDQASAHLIINQKQVSNEQLDIACSLLLLISKLTTGEIVYTTRNNLTRGDGLAKVNVLTYQSITMRHINPIAINLLKKEQRVHE